MIKNLLQHIDANGQYLNYELQRAFLRINFLVTPIYGASLTSAFNFWDAFWLISSRCLLDFNLQSKFIPNSFSLRELLICKSLLKSIHQYSASFGYSKTSLQGFPLFPVEISSHMLCYL